MLSHEILGLDEGKAAGKKKVLCVTHASVMRAITASKLRLDKRAVGSVFDPYTLAGGKDY